MFNIEKITKASASKLRNLSDTISKQLRALKVLEQEVDSWDVIIIHLIAKCLDSHSLSKWEEFKALKEEVSLNTMYEFLENHASLLEQLEGSSNQAYQNKSDYYNKDKKQIKNKSEFINDRQSGRR